MQTKIVIASSGLGHIPRGYESFSLELCQCLSMEPNLEVRLIGGSWKTIDVSQIKDQYIRIPVLRRRFWLTRLIAKLFRKMPYYIEQVSFSIFLCIYLKFLKPDLVLLSDGTLSNILWQARPLFKFQFAHLFSNGAPFPGPFKQCSFVQQLLDVHAQESLKVGQESKLQMVVPYGIFVDKQGPLFSTQELVALRNKLGIPVDRQIVLAVGALNVWHKRLDYVMREFAKLEIKNPYLVMLGSDDREAYKIRALAESILGPTRVQCRTANHDDVIEFMRASDVMVLASTQEGLARVLLEAGSAGLPCIVHDYSVTQTVLGEFGIYGDLTKEGVLQKLISDYLEHPWEAERKIKFRNFIAGQYSWDALLPKYLELINKTIKAAKEGSLT